MNIKLTILVAATVFIAGCDTGTTTKSATTTKEELLKDPIYSSGIRESACNAALSKKTGPGAISANDRPHGDGFVQDTVERPGGKYWLCYLDSNNTVTSLVPTGSLSTPT